jgi:TfoX/Sxy family transcriptional regulator of competence genes
MAYNEDLAERVRRALRDDHDVTEKRMFGGLAFLLRGHMCVGISNDDLMVRVGPAAYNNLVRQPHARPMDFTGKPMKGFLYVASTGLASDFDLLRWVNHGVGYTRTLPFKTPAAISPPPKKRPKPTR